MDAIELSEVQEILTELFEVYRSTVKARRISDNKFAQMMRIRPVTWNTYINGTRTPDLANALIIGEFIARYMGNETRERFLRAAGHQMYYRVNDSQLQFIIEEWRNLDTKTQKEIHDHVTEMQQARLNGPPPPEKRGRGRPPAP
jgi:hypothetical protein